MGVVWRIAQFLHEILNKLLNLVKVLLSNAFEVQVKKFHFHGEDKSWALVLAFRKDADWATTLNNNFSANCKAHAYSFLIQGIVLGKLAESFEQFILLGGVNSFSWIWYRDSEHLGGSIVGRSDFYFAQDRKFKRVFN